MSYCNAARFSSLLLLVLCSACASTPSAPTSPTPAQPVTASAMAQEHVASTQPADPNAGEMICKRFEKTGTRLSKEKICMTKRDWDLNAQRNKETLQRVERPESLNGN